MCYEHNDTVSYTVNIYVHMGLNLKLLTGFIIYKVLILKHNTVILSYPQRLRKSCSNNESTEQG